MRTTGEIKLKRNERACDEGCFTVNDALLLLQNARAEYGEKMGATISIAGADCRYMRAEVRDGVVTLVLDERHPDA